MKSILACAALATLLGAAASAADYTRGTRTAAVFAGLGGSSSRYDYQPGEPHGVTGGGGAFGAQALYYLVASPAVAIGADINDSLNGNQRRDDVLTGFDTTARLRSFTGLVIAKLAYPRGTWRPYIFAGLGGHHSHQELWAQPQAGHAWSGGGTESRAMIDESKTSVALGYGIGLDAFLTDTVFIGTELRNTWLAGLDTDDNAALRSQGFTVDRKENLAQGNVFFRIGWMF